MKIPFEPYLGLTDPNMVHNCKFSQPYSLLGRFWSKFMCFFTRLKITCQIPVIILVYGNTFEPYMVNWGIKWDVKALKALKHTLFSIFSHELVSIQKVLVTSAADVKHLPPCFFSPSNRTSVTLMPSLTPWMSTYSKHHSVLLITIHSPYYTMEFTLFTRLQLAIPVTILLIA